MTGATLWLRALGVVALAALHCVWLAPPVADASCNEAICASLVSKCLLVKACECDMSNKKNCSCCSQCSKCLAKRYPYCCSCLGLCDSLSSHDSYLNTSSVEELSDPIPDLFGMLTGEENMASTDKDSLWTVYRYPALESLMQLHQQQQKMMSAPLSEAAIASMSAQALNCTVAYVNQCTSLRGCKEMCKSMGAAKLRWFHEHGCCQCVDSGCYDYGRSWPLCSRCPPDQPPGAGTDDGMPYDDLDEFDPADEPPAVAAAASDE